MSEFKYVARTAQGNVIKKVVNAENEHELREKLRKDNLYVVSIHDQTKSDSVWNMTIGNPIKIKDIAVFCRQMSAMLSAGVTIVKALDIMYQQTEKKAMKASVKKLYENVQRGEMFSEALKKQRTIYPAIMISIIESGEASGSLDLVMQKLSTQFEKDIKLKNKIQSAMIYPIILLSVCIVAVCVLVVFVLPTFADLLTSSGGTLPAPTRILLWLSDFLVHNWMYVLGGIILLVVGLRLFVKSEGGGYLWDGLKLKIPIVGKTVSKIAAVRFCQTLSLLLLSGVSLLPALRYTSQVVTNKVIQKSLLSVEDDMKKGMQLSASVKKTGHFPALVVAMLSIGEESGTIDALLEKVSDYLDEEVDTAIQRLVGMLEPLLIVFMALVIGFVVISVVMPMFGIYSTI